MVRLVWMAPFFDLGWPFPSAFLRASPQCALCTVSGIRHSALGSTLPITLISVCHFASCPALAFRWISLAVLESGVMRLLRKPSWQMSVLTGVSVAITALMYWYYAWFFIMIVALVLLPIGLTKQKWRITPLMTAALVSSFHHLLPCFRALGK